MELLRSPGFSAYTKRLMDKHHVPGLAIAIVHGDEIESAGFGQASLSPPLECNADTLFDIGSVAKSLTAASVALLVADDERYPQVQYETVMSSLLPDDFVMPGDDHSDVTVEDILSHRTGMAGHDHSYLGQNATQPDDARSVTRNLRNLPVAAPNRDKFIYCNMMYTVATYLVERISGLPFPSFLDQYLLQPLSMDSTTLQPHRARAKGMGNRIATGYAWDKDAGDYRAIQCYDRPEAQGAGCIISSVNDYIKWPKAMMNREGPITGDVYNGLMKKRISQDPPEDEHQDPHSPHAFYAAGWQLRHYCGYLVAWHEGSDEGFRSNHFFLPELKFGGVIFSNSDGASEAVEILTEDLIDGVMQNPIFKSLLGMNMEPHTGSVSDDDDDDDDDSDDGDDEELEELRQELCPGIEGSQPQEMFLNLYTGRYWNPGYRGIEVEDKQGKLFVDATDRGMGFTLTFEHVGEQTKYIAYMRPKFEAGNIPIKAEFELQNEKAVKLGLQLEEELDEYIWFDRVHE
ncbi:hypothetical protein PT974_01605 [Cladobotryum mycophilum]|uniref:Beta-lactamase family protein n=1 Tax=Cladobotryum mycophilum TaxID=491253 RepID=A0ABR0T4S0_9HYPO